MKSKILIVEDDPDLRHLYGTALLLEGFDVQTAADGLDALRHVESNPPDLVLLDLGLPDIPGRSVLNELAANAHTRRIPVVIVTGHDPEGLPAHAACIIRKPVETPHLIHVVRRCLQQPLASVSSARPARNKV